MKRILRLTAHVLLGSVLLFVSFYTGFMGSFFSLTGMWISDTEVMVLYAMVFVNSSLALLLTIRKTEWFLAIKHELFLISN